MGTFNPLCVPFELRLTVNTEHRWEIAANSRHGLGFSGLARFKEGLHDFTAMIQVVGRNSPGKKHGLHFTTIFRTCSVFLVDK